MNNFGLHVNLQPKRVLAKTKIILFDKIEYMLIIITEVSFAKFSKVLTLKSQRINKARLRVGGQSRYYVFVEFLLLCSNGNLC